MTEQPEPKHLKVVVTKCLRCKEELRPHERPEGFCDQCLKTYSWPGYGTGQR